MNKSLRLVPIIFAISASPVFAAAPTTAPATAPAVDPAIAKALAQKIPELKLDAIGFRDVIDFLRDVTAVNLVVDWTSVKRVGASEKTPISLNINGETLKAALDEVLAKAAEKGKLVAVPGDGMIFILAREDVGPLQATEKMREKPVDPVTAKLLARPLPEMNLDRVSFYDATEFLKDITGAKLDVHWPALQAAGVKKTSPVTVRLTNTPLRAVLTVLLQSAQAHSKEPLDYKIRNGVIHISTVADLKPPAAAKN